jgi:hypothetical protein
MVEKRQRGPLVEQNLRLSEEVRKGPEVVGGLRKSDFALCETRGLVEEPGMPFPKFPRSFITS